MGTLLFMRRRRVQGELIQLIEDDDREIPMYSVAKAASYLSIPRGTLRHWLKATPTKRAIIEADTKSGELSFYNLVEAHILRVAIARNVTLANIRAAVEVLRERHPNHPHPLIKDSRYTAGTRSLFAMTLAGEIENLSKGGQLAFLTMHKKHLSRIDWDASGPYQVRPLRYTRIALNYRVSGGSPVIVGTGIRADVIAMRLRGGEDLKEVAREYGISAQDVREAQRYEAA